MHCRQWLLRRVVAVFPLAQRTQACSSQDHVIQQQSYGTQEHLLGHCTLFKVRVVMWIRCSSCLMAAILGQGVMMEYVVCLIHVLGMSYSTIMTSIPPQGTLPMSPLLLSLIRGVSYLLAIPMATAMSGTPFWLRCGCYHFRLLKVLILCGSCGMITIFQSSCYNAPCSKMFDVQMV
jgi:hypothetical protein